MRWRRIAVVTIALMVGLLADGGATARAATHEVIVVVVGDSTFRDFVGHPPVDVAFRGGVAMLRGPDPSREALDALEASGVTVTTVPPDAPWRVGIADRIAGPAADPDRQLLVIVVGLAPRSGIEAEGPDAVALARGPAGELVGTLGERSPRTLTSDSTRRQGVVTPADIVATVEDALGHEVPGFDEGTPIRMVPTEPPVDLYERYLRYRSLSAPIQAAVGVWETAVGLVAVWALARARSLRRPALGAALSLPVLFLALLLVGHLPSLGFVTVVPTLVLVTTISGLLLVRVADRAGVGVALAWAGGIGLGGLVVESLLGWTAAFAPMLGGSHLDGARFFGMPNVEIGLALGGATLLAARLGSILAGGALVFAVGLWAGSPWLASNLGASVTLFAAAGLWWGIRGERGWLRTAVATLMCAAAGVLLVVFAHRELTEAPTHITRFAETGGGPGGLVSKAIDRLGIGLRLLREQPPALIPVLGTPIALWVVVRRPPRALLDGFALEPSARPAALTILVGSVVAYVANDTGAAALGLGFGLAMVTLFAVSLAARRAKMEP